MFPPSPHENKNNYLLCDPFHILWISLNLNEPDNNQNVNISLSVKREMLTVPVPNKYWTITTRYWSDIASLKHSSALWSVESMRSDHKWRIDKCATGSWVDRAGQSRYATTMWHHQYKMGMATGSETGWAVRWFKPQLTPVFCVASQVTVTAFNVKKRQTKMMEFSIFHFKIKPRVRGWTFTHRKPSQSSHIY